MLTIHLVGFAFVWLSWPPPEPLPYPAVYYDEHGISLHDLDRFPNQKTCRQMLEWNRQYQASLRAVILVAHDGDLAILNAEYTDTQKRFWVVDRLDDAFYYSGNDVKRSHLRRLREMLGETDYQLGRLPCYLPAPSLITWPQSGWPPPSPLVDEP